jgi:hypothetical protein
MSEGGCGKPGPSKSFISLTPIASGQPLYRESDINSIYMTKFATHIIKTLRYERYESADFRSLPRVHLNHFSIAMIKEDNLQKSPKSSLKQRNTRMDGATSYVENLYKEGDLDPVYYAKTLVLNRALQELGMGKYQVIMTICLS